MEGNENEKVARWGWQRWLCSVAKEKRKSQWISAERAHDPPLSFFFVPPSVPLSPPLPLPKSSSLAVMRATRIHHVRRIPKSRDHVSNRSVEISKWVGRFERDTVRSDVCIWTKKLKKMNKKSLGGVSEEYVSLDTGIEIEHAVRTLCTCLLALDTDVVYRFQRDYRREGFGILSKVRNEERKRTNEQDDDQLLVFQLASLSPIALN